ncbi:MAG: hypothetical protein WCW61_00310 [Patescibacteria group bacterium]|jgi:hypothetical protein
MKITQLPNLDESVMQALDFFKGNPPTKLNLKTGVWRFVVGSGNAYNTGKIIFKGRQAIFASESDFLEKLSAYKDLIKSGIIKEALIISASGEKDATWEIAAAKKAELKTILMTCSPQSSGAKIADLVIPYRKIAEPQTYNISTYLGMIMSLSGEKAQDIKKIIQKLRLPKNYTAYNAYTFVLPDEFTEITPMLEIKRHELFGPHLSLRAFSAGEARHAKFVMPWEKELVISLGENKYFGLKEHRFQVKMPKNYGPGLVMALTYYLIGQIQKAKTPYYKKNIAKYCVEGPKAYGKKEPFEVIVPGN